MSEPTNPDDTAGLHLQVVTAMAEVFPGQTYPTCSDFLDRYLEEMARAAAATIVPPGFVVVSTDDLRAVLRIYQASWGSSHSDYEALDRLRAKVEPK